jgi:hypothetical protein
MVSVFTYILYSDNRYGLLTIAFLSLLQCFSISFCVRLRSYRHTVNMLYLSHISTMSYILLTKFLSTLMNIILKSNCSFNSSFMSSIIGFIFYVVSIYILLIYFSYCICSFSLFFFFLTLFFFLSYSFFFSFLLFFFFLLT